MSSIDPRLLEQLKELIGGDQEALNELIGTFQMEGGEIVVDMQKALPSQDIDLLRRSAHSLKSSAQDFGASELSSACASLEAHCKTGWPEGAMEQVSMIAERFEDARVDLQSYLDQ